MNAIAVWKDLYTSLRWAESTADDATAAIRANGTPTSAQHAIRQAVLDLRRPEPLSFSDAPDHDFVGLVGYYGAVVERLCRAVGRGMTDPALRSLALQSSIEADRQARWIGSWRLRTPLGTSWVLDGASVRLRFVHQRLRHDLAFEPGDAIDDDFAYIAAAIAQRTAELAQSAGELCRDQAVRDFATAIQPRAAGESTAYRNWLLDRRTIDRSRQAA